ncbi:ABC transporter ATP-binding protein [Geobacillus thermoleovorans]|uniref:ABC transporter ATP-binding protein n=1 Tax=Geobacillus thermoleovorans TaxID=33941 RepID=UPI000845E250|nr:ABC transporter ATP-binding protein [Geobacillus thermoleovorans]AOL34349.1 ABC transporter ATP-binding protein [Geobacillus thermoleovorans]
MRKEAEKDVILHVEGISKHFGGLQIIKHVSLTVKKGERIGIIGPNGAGKTTFFNLLTGDLLPTGGKIYYKGKEITRMPNFRRAQAGIVRTFQKNNLLNELTVLDNLLLVLQRKRGMANIWFKPRNARRWLALFEEAEHLLQTWGLADIANERVKTLSYGEQRQVEILLGIAMEPDVLLLDEPTAGMSQAETNYIAELLRQLPKDITMMVIEHDLDVVFGLAERMIVLYNGSIFIDGAPEEVRSDERVNDIYIGKEKAAGASYL